MALVITRDASHPGLPAWLRISTCTCCHRRSSAAGAVAHASTGSNCIHKKGKIHARQDIHLVPIILDQIAGRLRICRAQYAHPLGIEKGRSRLEIWEQKWIGAT